MTALQDALVASKSNFKELKAVAIVAFSFTPVDKGLAVDMATLSNSQFTKEQYDVIIAALQHTIDHCKFNTKELFDNMRRLNN